MIAPDYVTVCAIIADALQYDSWQEEFEEDAQLSFQGVVFLLLVACVATGDYGEA